MHHRSGKNDSPERRLALLAQVADGRARVDWTCVEKEGGKRNREVGKRRVDWTCVRERLVGEGEGM
jgi:hypothetical protein